jgi:flagellin FlaB
MKSEWKGRIKMRKNWSKMRRDRRADIGIGTMIVFIAMVLVAAVAAAVLISTANQVREQATSTGDQAIGNVASGFIRESVLGQTTSATVIDTITIDVRLAAGSPPINFANVVVKWTYGATDTVLQYAMVAASGKFTAAMTAGVSSYKVWGPLITDPHIIGSGDMVTITIATAISVAPLSHLVIEILPALGQPCIVDLQTPEYFPVLADSWVVLA